MADAKLSLTLADVPLGVLDLAPIPEGSTAGDALRATIEHATIIIAGLQRGRARLGG